MHSQGCGSDHIFGDNLRKIVKIIMKFKYSFFLKSLLKIKDRMDKPLFGCRTSESWSPSRARRSAAGWRPGRWPWWQGWCTGAQRGGCTWFNRKCIMVNFSVIKVAGSKTSHPAGALLSD